MDKALGYLGLAARAGKIKVGAEDCAREAARRKNIFLVAASDAAGGTLERAQTMAAGRGGRLIPTAYTKKQIADAIGRDMPVALVMITDEGLAQAFSAAVDMDRGEQEERV